MDSYLRRVLRIALSGVVCVLAVMAAGRVTERLILGADDAAIRARVERDLRGAFGVMSRGLQDVARRVADARTLEAAARDDENAARRLFDMAQAAVVANSADVELAVTAYGPAAARSHGRVGHRSFHGIDWKATKPGSSPRVRSVCAWCMRCPSPMPQAIESGRSV